ncbi:MAG: hypothetical protein NFW16_10725 [Candidatus Accumulibacter sp.]|uniref:hypothetical protein n=1 Tax=Accumulibacter sp. TaxID=2053492 RepID=UPI00258557A6|nr:hypothetical protein [Accumulibacter sp.]MCM8622182.1 hypothetical protein [Accumulibacter sp.]
MEIVLGDNPFFGVNHRAGSKPLESEEARFEEAAQVIRRAVEQDIATFMLSTHPGYERLLARADAAVGEAGKTLRIALVLPYPHSLNSLVAERGYAGLLGTIGLPGIFSSGVDLVRSLFPGRRASLVPAFRSLIRAELSRASPGNLQVVYACLHNVVTDIMLASGRVDVLRGFIEASHQLALRPVLISQNPIRLLSRELGRNYTACFSFNPLGYMVNPSLQETEQYLLKNEKRLPEGLWAMQILASGACSMEALLQLDSLRAFDALLYATSRPDRIAPFAAAIKARFG